MAITFDDIFTGYVDAMSPSNQRWYDQYPDLQKSLVILASFPPQILDIVAEGIVELAERDCKANEIIRSLKSLGKEKILALHQSKARRRFYDHNPQLHKAMNYIFVLSESNRQYVCQKMKSLIEYVFDYLKTCDEFKAIPTQETIGTLATTFVRKGSPAARTFLDGVRKNFEHDLRGLPSQHTHTNVRIGTSDMRISAAD